MASVPSNACAPVGPTSCAEGFAPSGTGWGCEAVTTAEACTGATRAALGETTCLPLDDCDRAFPPAGAALVRDDASLASALASARPGATIAMEAGTYAGFEVPSDVAIVGRCAARVVVKGGATGRGIYVVDTRKVSLASLTVDGFEGGIVAAWGAEVVASALVIKNSACAVVAGEAKLTLSRSVIEQVGGGDAGSATKAATLVVEESEVRGKALGFQAYERGTALTVRRSVLRSDHPGAGNAFMVFGGAHVLLDESALRTRGKLAFVSRTLPDVQVLADAMPGELEIRRSHVAHSGNLDAPLTHVEEGHLTLHESTLEHQSASAVMAGMVGSTVTVRGSVIRGHEANDVHHVAVWLLRGAVADVDGSAIVDAQGLGLMASHEGTRLGVTRSVVTHTLTAHDVAPEFGAGGIALMALEKAAVSIEGSAFVDSQNYGVLSYGAQLSLVRSVVDRTSISPEMLGGAGVGAYDSRLTIQESLVRDSQDVALVFKGGDGIVKRTRFVANPVGVEIGGSRLVDAATDPSVAAPGELVFFENVFDRALLVREAPADDVPLE